MIGRNCKREIIIWKSDRKVEKMESLTYVICTGGGGRRGVGGWRGTNGKYMGRVGIDKGR